MKSYAEGNIFTVFEVKLFQHATRYVAAINSPETTKKIRCHELARAVGLLLDLPYQDGFYGFVDHSWLWTRPLDQRTIITPRIGLPNILDVYSVGSLPMVRLVGLPHVGWGYRPSEERKDIDIDFVQSIAKVMKDWVNQPRPETLEKL
jgi:hypothetical protein